MYGEYVRGGSDDPIHLLPKREGAGKGIIRRKKAEVYQGETKMKIDTRKMPIHHVDYFVTAKQEVVDQDERSPEDEIMALEDERLEEERGSTNLPSHLEYLEGVKSPRIVHSSVPEGLTGRKNIVPQIRERVVLGSPQGSVEREPISVEAATQKPGVNGRSRHSPFRGEHRAGHKPMSHRDYHEKKARVDRRLVGKSVDKKVDTEEDNDKPKNFSYPEFERQMIGRSLKIPKSKRRVVEEDPEIPLGTMQSSVEKESLSQGRKEWDKIQKTKANYDTHKPKVYQDEQGHYHRTNRKHGSEYRGHRAGHKDNSHARDANISDRRRLESRADYSENTHDSSDLRSISAYDIIPGLKHGKYEATVGIIEARLRDLTCRPEFEKAIKKSCQLVRDFFRRHQKEISDSADESGRKRMTPEMAEKKYLSFLTLFNFEIHHRGSSIGHRAEPKPDEVYSYLSDAIIKSVEVWDSVWPVDSDLRADFELEVMKAVRITTDEMSKEYLHRFEEDLQAFA